MYCGTVRVEGSSGGYVHICDGIASALATAGGKEQVDPVEAVFGALPGHFKLPTTLEGRLGRSCPIYETVNLGLGMPVMLSNEWGVSEGRLGRHPFFISTSCLWRGPLTSSFVSNTVIP